MRGGTKKIIIILISVAVIIGGFAFYLNGVLSSYKSTLSQQPAGPPPQPSISAQLINQSFMSGDSGSKLIPYALLDLHSLNASAINVYASILQRPVPQSIYIFNTTNECYQCGNVTQVTSALITGLLRYGAIKYPGAVSFVSGASLQDIANNSVLIVTNGYIPQVFLSGYNGTQNTTIEHLLRKGTSIIYVGADFSHMLEQGSIIVPSGAIPDFLNTGQFNATKVNLSTFGVFGNFSFSRPTYALSSGTFYGPISYRNIDGGSLVVFSNYGNAWPNATLEGRDIAKAIATLFWIPEYASGSESYGIRNFTAFSGHIGVIMNQSGVQYGSGQASLLGNYYGRIMLYTNSSFNATAPDSAFYSVDYVPHFGINGSMSIPSYVIPAQRTPFDIEIYTHSATPVSLLPHLQIYDQNMSEVEGIALPSIPQAIGNFSFVKYLAVSLPAGRYIVALDNFSNAPYAYSLFNVNLSVTLQNANFSSGRFVFLATSAGQPLSGVNYSISLYNPHGNYAYPTENGTLTNGTMVYTLHSGQPAAYYVSNFTVDILSTEFGFSEFNAAPVIPITTQDIEILAVMLLLAAMVLFVRPPNRDEFYVDVPHMPPKNKTQVKVKSAEIISVFDKMNLYYHWNHMPLSKGEIKLAISKYINFAGMPLNLTFNNIDRILDAMVESGKLATIDGLYAPQSWLGQGQHDIVYLSTFKKLRVFFVSHGYVFTEIDASNVADMVATQHGEHAYIVIYSKTSRFANMPIFQNSKTYLAFINSESMYEFKANLYNAATKEAEMLKLYIASGSVELIDSDNQQPIMT